MKKRLIKIILIAIGIFLISWWIWAYIAGKREDAREQQEYAQQEEQYGNKAVYFLTTFSSPTSSPEELCAREANFLNATGTIYDKASSFVDCLSSMEDATKYRYAAEAPSFLNRFPAARSQEELCAREIDYAYEYDASATAETSDFVNCMESPDFWFPSWSVGMSAINDLQN